MRKLEIINANAVAQALDNAGENNILRGIIAVVNIPCVYCGLDDMSKCEHGFPGCAQADDLLCGQDMAWKALVEERNELRARVEELERDGKELGETFENLLRSKGPHITPKMINAAVNLIIQWKEYEIWHHRTFTNSHTNRAAYKMWRLLNELNIFRCEASGCVNGIYTEGNDDGSQTQERKCELCNGHAWVIRNE